MLLRIIFLIAFTMESSFADMGISSAITDSVIKNIARTTSAQANQNITYQMFHPELKVENDTGGIRTMSLSPGGEFISIVSEDDVLHVWELNAGIRRLKFNLSSKITSTSVTSGESNEGIVVVGSSQGEIQVYSVKSSLKICDFHLGNESASQVAITNDGSRVAAVSGESGNVWIYDLKNNCMFLEQFTIEGKVHDIDFSPDGKRLILGSDTKKIIEWDVELKKILNSMPIESEILAVGYIDNKKNVAAITKRGISFFSNMGDLKNDPVDDLEIAELSDAGIGVLGGNGKLFVYDFVKNSKLASIDINTDQMHHVHFLNQSRQIIFTSLDGQVHFWDTLNNKEIFKIIITRSGWAVLDSSGRFDATEDGIKDISWVVDNKKYSLNNFSKAFYEPGLLRTRIKSFQPSTSQMTDKFENGVALPPKVEIDFEGTIFPANEMLPPVVVIATDQGGGIGEIRLYHNGKLVDPGAMIKTEDVDIDGKHMRVAGFAVKSVIGLNNFVAVGEGLWGIEGQSEKVTLTGEGIEPQPTLHLVTVGINKYLDQKMNLDYSVADADSLASTIAKNSKSIYNLDRVDLRDGVATKKTILDTLHRVLAESSPNDLVVLYFAGHGLVAANEWRFLPYDTLMGQHETDYQKSGVTSSDLQDMLAKAKPKRILMLIDSCHSGATTEVFSEQQQFQRKFLREVSRINGITVIAASRKDQFATEARELGHGIFTYELIDALTGKADSLPTDTNISSHEVAEFITKSLPTTSLKYAKYPQEPMTFRLGADFVVGKTN